MVTQRSLATAEGYAAQPGEQASSPATRSAMVIFATSSEIKNTTSCTTDAGETPAFQANAVFTLPLVRRRDACGLCFAERLWRWPGIRCGGDSDESYRRLLSRLRCGGDFGGNYYRQYNRRRRDACYPGCAAGATLVEITTACTTDAGETPAFSALQSAFGDGQASAAGATLVEITTAYTTDAGETPAIQAALRGRL